MSKTTQVALAALFLCISAASAQNVTVIGPITPGDIPIFNSTTIIKDSGVAGGAALFANPSAAVGLTAVNGSALTAMRSDAAPPLSSSVQSALTQTTNQILIGTGGFGFTSIVLGGDCTFSSPNITCTKTGGVPFGTMATQNANNVAITGGSITGMPTPTNASDVATKSYVDTKTNVNFGVLAPAFGAL